MKTASEIVFDTYIKPTEKMNYEFIGTEFEYPIFSKNSDLSLTEVGDMFLKYLIKEHGYREAIKGSNGALVRVDKDGDSVSFDYHYAMLELSMAPRRNLFDIKKSVDSTLDIVVDFYKDHDFEILGQGNFYPTRQKSEFTYDPFYTMIRAFLTECAKKTPVDKYLCDMCSTQTHLNVSYEHLLETYNLFNELSFVRGLLFSNSPKECEDGVCYCNRDRNWDKCGVPNTGIYDFPFSSLEDLADAIAKEVIFVKMDGEKLSFMDPVALTDYFEKQNNPEENIAFFRSFKHVVINKYNCLEVREDCTQPMEEALLPVAFNLGMALGYERAYTLLKDFKKEAGITEGNSLLRYRAVRDSLKIDEILLKEFLNNLYDVAYTALMNRRLGEESLLLPMKKRIEKGECPGKALFK